MSHLPALEFFLCSVWSSQLWDMPETHYQTFLSFSILKCLLQWEHLLVKILLGHISLKLIHIQFLFFLSHQRYFKDMHMKYWLLSSFLLMTPKLFQQECHERILEILWLALLLTYIFYLSLLFENACLIYSLDFLKYCWWNIFQKIFLDNLISFFF